MNSDKAEITCIVTIHGIGFQQPPSTDAEGKPVAGYADALHMHLCKVLNTGGNELLSNDPLQTASNVPIYVQGVWNASSDWEAKSDLPHPQNGLDRLGTWDKNRLQINYDEYPLVVASGAARIAHVALVYSELEGTTPEWLAAIETAAMADIYIKHYTNFRNLLDTVFQDTQPILREAQEALEDLMHHRASASAMPSLQVRLDQASPKNPPVKTPPGSNSILNALKDDVAAYVCHNGRRQRVRDFVLEALLRLTARDDVKAIVLNTHSNGTLIGIDVEQELSPSVSGQIHAIVTAGSPIRKYVDFFAWGKHLAVMPQTDTWPAQWFNFWDPEDPVADPLRPCPAWKKGVEPTTEPDQNTGIHWALDANDLGKGSIPIKIGDMRVNNVKNSSGGGLQAHNYWDNEKEFIPKLAEIVRNVHNGQQTPIVDPPLPLYPSQP